MRAGSSSPVGVRRQCRVEQHVAPGPPPWVLRARRGRRPHLSIRGLAAATEAGAPRGCTVARRRL